MKKLRILFFCVVLFLFNGVLYAKEDDAPKVRAEGAVLIEKSTGRVLYEKKAHTPMSMASTTKIMTALIALEEGDIDSIVVVSARAAKAPKVKMHLSVGEEVPLKGLLYALMLESSNDAAVAIAEHIGGSVEGFCHMMTLRARAMGAVNTSFRTPNGLDAENHYSTAYDLAIITAHALDNADFVKLINTRSANVKSSKREYSIHNKNRLLNEYDGAIGVKTGFTNKAGHCFVGAARQDMELISVVLASGWGQEGKEQKWKDTKTLLNHGFAHYSIEPIITEGEKAGIIDITRSKTKEIDIIFAHPFSLPLTEAELAEIDISLDFPLSMVAPIGLDEAIGIAIISLNGEELVTIPLKTTAEALRHDFKTSIMKVLNTL